VPPDAVVYLNDTQTQQTGPVRQFVTPPLGAGDYQYRVRVTWKENAQQRSEERLVTIHAGDNIAVTIPARTAPSQP
jgi:uncharacterized protein (TIGR03000 family)